MGNKRVGKTVAGFIIMLIGFMLCFNAVSSYKYSYDLKFSLILPALLGICCFVFAIKLMYIKRAFFKNKALKNTIISIILICLLIFIAIEALIIIDPFIQSAESAGKVDTLIVLGCGIWPDGSPTLALIMRLDKAAQYYSENPHINIIVSGGQGPTEPFSEAHAMEEYLVSKGIPKEKIIKEDKSTSTRENFEFSKKLMDKDQGQTTKIVFVTNDFHVLRSRIIAKRFGFEAYALPAKTPGVIVVGSYLREFFAFIKSMLFDN